MFNSYYSYLSAFFEIKYNFCELYVREMCQHCDKITTLQYNNSKPHANDTLISSELISWSDWTGELWSSLWIRVEAEVVTVTKLACLFHDMEKAASVWPFLVDVDGRDNDWYSDFELRNKVPLLSPSLIYYYSFQAFAILFRKNEVFESSESIWINDWF